MISWSLNFETVELLGELFEQKDSHMHSRLELLENCAWGWRVWRLEILLLDEENNLIINLELEDKDKEVAEKELDLKDEEEKEEELKLEDEE